MTFYLFRKPSTMEDEGRHEFVGSRLTLAEAAALRDRLVADAKGYYGDGDYVVTQSSTFPTAKEIALRNAIKALLPHVEAARAREAAMLGAGEIQDTPVHQALVAAKLAMED